MSWPKCFTNKGKRKQSHHMHQHCYHYYHTNQLLSKQLCAWIVAMALADLVVFHPFTFHLSTFLDFECSLKVVEIIFLSSESLVFFFFLRMGLCSFSLNLYDVYTEWNTQAQDSMSSCLSTFIRFQTFQTSHMLHIWSKFTLTLLVSLEKSIEFKMKFWGFNTALRQRILCV